MSEIQRVIHAMNLSLTEKRALQLFASGRRVAKGKIGELYSRDLITGDGKNWRLTSTGAEALCMINQGEI